VTDIVFAYHERVLLTDPARAGLQSYHRTAGTIAAGRTIGRLEW
jgi:hypothetical protein